MNNRAQFDVIIEHRDDPNQWPVGWRTRDQVWAALNKQYETINLSAVAQQEYDNCTIKKKPFANFIAEFNRYASRCSKTDEQKVVDLKIRVF